MVNQASFSAIILAAGLSSRMGQEKVLLEHVSGVTFLEHLAHEYHRFGCHKIIFVMNPQGVAICRSHNFMLPANVQFIVNEHPGFGRFSSVRAGAEHVKDQDYVFLQNIDNPATSQNILNYLSEHACKADRIRLVYQSKGGHPVLISSMIINEILNEKDDKIVLKTFLKRFSVYDLAWSQADVLLNINTMEDYSIYCRSLIT